MPFFRPERALSQLLRHHPDAFSPFLSRSSYAPLSRFFDPVHSPSPLCAPFFTVYDTSRPNTRHSQQPRTSEQSTQSSTQQSSTDSQENRVTRSDRSDEWLDRGRRHRGRHFHPLSLWSPFSSSFPSLFNAFATPFAPLASIPSMPDMTLDVFTNPQSYTVHAAVPGLDKKDIKITVDDGVLTIEAERRQEIRQRTQPTQPTTATDATTSAPPQPTTEAKVGEQSATESAGASGASEVKAQAESSTTVEEDEGFQHVESFYGRVQRSVQLPEDAKLEELTAKYENGVIKIEIPRMQQMKKEARRIEIQ